jgi:hypothetical protein
MIPFMTFAMITVLEQTSVMLVVYEKKSNLLISTSSSRRLALDFAREWKTGRKLGGVCRSLFELFRASLLLLV